MVPEELSERIMRENNLETLDAWIKLAVKVSDPDQFVREIGD